MSVAGLLSFPGSVWMSVAGGGGWVGDERHRWKVCRRQERGAWRRVGWTERSRAARWRHGCRRIFAARCRLGRRGHRLRVLPRAVATEADRAAASGTHRTVLRPAGAASRRCTPSHTEDESSVGPPVPPPFSSPFRPLRRERSDNSRYVKFVFRSAHSELNITACYRIAPAAPFLPFTVGWGDLRSTVR